MHIYLIFQKKKKNVSRRPKPVFCLFASVAGNMIARKWFEVMKVGWQSLFISESLICGQTQQFKFDNLFRGKFDRNIYTHTERQTKWDKRFYKYIFRYHHFINQILVTYLLSSFQILMWDETVFPNWEQINQQEPSADAQGNISSTLELFQTFCTV